MNQYRVKYRQTATVEREMLVDADSPEDAARFVEVDDDKPPDDAPLEADWSRPEVLRVDVALRYHEVAGVAVVRRCGQSRVHLPHRWGHDDFDAEAHCDGRPI